MKKFVALLGLAAALSVTALNANAGVLLLDNYDSGATGTQRNSAYGILAKIVVGTQDVSIDQFGVFGRQITAGNIRFDIFDSTKARVYDSGSTAVSSKTTNKWYDSPIFDLTLKANSTYYFGLLSTQSFYYSYEIPAVADIGKGLTSPEAGVAGSNGNFNNFTNPQVMDYSYLVQQNTRIFGTDPNAVPEPTSLALLGIGALALARRRNRK